MIGLLIATHADLAHELLRAAEMVIGPLEAVRTVGVCREDNVEDVRTHILNELTDLDDGDGVLVMTDMFGGTPSNISLSFLDPKKIEVLSGVNLPMVLKFCNSREGVHLPDLALMLKAYGQQCITLASEFLEK